MPAIEPETAQAVQLEKVTAQQTEHLLIVSIGPVQDFIAAARKCQDLWFGSFLLSELARALAQGLHDQQATLIFPGSKLNTDDLSVANKVVAKLPRGLAPIEVVQTARQKMDEWLNALAHCAFKMCERAMESVAKVGEQLFLREVAQKQVDDLIELQWVAVPITDYEQAHADAERLLAWRKNTRDFGSVPWGADHVPKSSIDGQRESVIRDEFFDRMKSEVRLGEKYRLGPNERLCGVGILKRYGAEIVETPETEDEKKLIVTVRPVFHSNSHVAAGPLFQRIKMKGNAGRDALQKYIEKLKALGVRTDRFKVRPKRHEKSESDNLSYDGYLLYPDRLPDVFKEESSVPLDTKDSKPQQEAVRNAQAELQHLFAQLVCPQSEPYYAILAADGDHMGAAIRALSHGKDAAGNHIKLSAALADFANKTRELVEKDHAGSLIYSGGDDVLALLPLHTALACARALSKKFVEIVQPACPPLEARPTLSVGLAVVHHLEHMGRARKLAHDAEKLAKTTRNSLAITVDKRSGATFSVSGQWDETPRSIDQRIEEWAKLFAEDALPDGVAFELLELLAPFEISLPTGEKPEDAPTAEIASLVRRVFARKQSPDGQTALPKDLVEKLTKRITPPNTSGKHDPIAAVRALSYELQMAREFARAKKLAEGG